MAQQDGWDLIIIGGGLGGVICLKYALDAGLRALLLEREAGVGGLWRSLPSWQDIQFRKEEWTLGDLPIAGEDQGSILRNIEGWVERFGLEPHLRLSTPVRAAVPCDGGWRVETAQDTFQARFLVAATGGFNRPRIPTVGRAGAGPQEFHSSTLRDPSRLAGKEVVVVGGGASAYDLLDLCFEHGAAGVHWVYRSLKWMTPSLESKHAGAGMRKLAKAQMLRLPVRLLNLYFNRKLRARYLAMDLAELIPARPFDLARDQLLPGRSSMLKHIKRIQRHPGEVERLDGETVQLKDGSRLRADLVLWGTGFEADLGYLKVGALSALTSLEPVAARCGAHFLALDAPGLFLLSPGLFDSNGSTPWAYAHAAKSIMAHVQGGRVFGEDVAPGKIQYFDLPWFLASRDRANYPFGTWILDYLRLAFLWERDKPFPLP